MATAPVILSSNAPYLYKWTEANILISVDRVDDGKRAVIAEITIESYPKLEHIWQSRFNMTSSQSRLQLSKQLQPKIPSIDQILESLCLTFLKQLRQGEPVIEIGNLPRRTALDYLLQPIILNKELNLIFGAGGIGKSYLAALCSLLIQTGYQYLNLVPKRANVLYLDYETSSEELNQRIVNLKEGLGITLNEGITYRLCSQPLHEEIPEIRRIIGQHNIGFLVVDSIGGACGGEPESAEVILRFFTSLRSLKVTPLCIDHVAKVGTAGTPFGSIYKFNTVRNLFEMKKNQEVGEDFLEVALIHRKINVGKLLEPIGYRFNFQEDKTLISSIEPSQIPELSKDLPIKKRLRELLLTEGAMTIPQMAEELNESADSIKKALNRAKNKLFIKLDGHCWGILANENIQEESRLPPRG
ncbi:MAG: AAA family ATPase [Planctomycetes bacterium]|nr:AAA family ATPase [Planctomycetota bacterium]